MPGRNLRHSIGDFFGGPVGKVSGAVSFTLLVVAAVKNEHFWMYFSLALVALVVICFARFHEQRQEIEGLKEDAATEGRADTRHGSATDLLGISLEVGRDLIEDTFGDSTYAQRKAWKDNTARLIGESFGHTEAELFATSPLAGERLPMSEAYKFDLVWMDNLREVIERVDTKKVHDDFDPADWQIDAAVGPQFVGTAKLSPELEPVGWVLEVNGRTWTTVFCAWVWAGNKGPTSTFAAQVVDITGVPADWGGGSYQVAEPAWDGKHAPTVEIPRGHSRRLKLASVLVKPRGFWFWTSEQGGEGPGHQWLLPDDEVADVRFTVEVTNLRNDRSLQAPGRITVPLDPGNAAFQLGDVTEHGVAA